MALTLRPARVSRPCPSLPLPNHHLLRPQLSFFAPLASTRVVSAKASFRAAPLFSARWCRRLLSGGAARSQEIAAEKHCTFRLLCSLQGDSAAVEPVEDYKQGPRLKWILLAAGVVVAGLFIYLRFRGGAMGTAGAGEAHAVQPSSGFGTSARFTMKLPVIGTLSLGDFTPGWVYFVLLMAAGFGLFVSEEALNVWVGASLGRLLSYGSQEAFLSSLGANTPQILSTIVWVYWGVCISDMVPFYAGKLASKSGDHFSEKLGVKKDKYEQVMANIQRYGNLIGFVERFSVGIRNPTAFLAGVAGISPKRFFAGVCLGGLFTLPIQMSVGFILRDRPVAALAGVAAFVGAWTVFPYAAAGLVSLIYLVRRFLEKPPE